MPNRRYSTKNKALRLSSTRRRRSTYNIEACLATRGIFRDGRKLDHSATMRGESISEERLENDSVLESQEPQQGNMVYYAEQTSAQANSQNNFENDCVLESEEPREGNIVYYAEQSSVLANSQNRFENGCLLESEEPPQVNGVVHEAVQHSAPTSSQISKPVTRKRKNLTLSQKRKKRVVNVGLLKWRIQNATAKVDEPLNVYKFEENIDQEQIVEDQYTKYINEEMDVEKHQLMIKYSNHDASRDPACGNISGRYIVDGQHFYREMRKLENHRSECNGYYRLLSTEVKSMIWTLKFECPECHITKVIHSEPTPEITASTRPLTVCDSAVWGTLAVGGGHGNMEELFSTMGIKTIDKKTFSKKENELGESWQQILFQTMQRTGNDEKQLAIENGDVDESGTPFITVIVDGGWSHRSHGHRYTSNSGVACVIGLRTKKLLHIDVRNKYCSMCLYLEKRNKTPGHEGCFRNWEGTSQGMEPDMLVEAFRSSKKLHGLEYRTVIGDGDSSVFSRLREMVPYGLKIQKSECANHAVKNYCKALFSQKHLSQAVRKILSQRIVLRLKKDARYAIYHIAETSCSAQELRDDLINGPAHVLGVHDKCKEYFCQKKENENELEGPRLAVYRFAQECLKPLIRKAHRLVHNDTSNLAENLMSLVAKFSGGKQTNHCKRGSYQNRCKAAALDFQLGSAWTYESMKQIVGKSPSSLIKKTAEKRTRAKYCTKRSLIKCRKERKAYSHSNTSQTTTRADNTDAHPIGGADYGPLCHDLDMDECQYKEAAEMFKSKLNLSEFTRRELELVTRGQGANELWHMERRSRVTASNFGEICKRRATTPSARLVEKLVYSTDLKHSDSIQYGRINEREAVEQYRSQHPERNVSDECGLFVHKNIGYLGASPDALIDADGILEVKCPFSARDMTLDEAIQNFKYVCLDRTGQLPRKHNYFYQIQGQLEIVDRAYCDFVLWGPKFFHTERIDRDSTFWTETMLPKLTDFYERFLLPELVDPRKCRSMPLRDKGQKKKDAIE